MADGGDRKGSLPWGMSAEGLKPNSVQAISQTKLKAFSLGRTNPVKKSSPFVKKKEEREQRRKLDAKEAAVVFEEFMASFDDSTKAGKTFVRGSDTVNPDASEGPSSSGTTAGDVLVYKPSKFVKASEESKPVIHSTTSVSKKPQKKKVGGGGGGGGGDKKKSILELFREELKRAQEERKERHVAREKGDLPLDADADAEITADIFKVDEYKEYMKGSFDTGDPLTTNLYVGNINPKMNEEMLCQIFGKFGPLASVKVMWPRTEEERSRNRNCGFVAFMKRQDGDRALEAMKGTTIMDYEIQVGWGKAVPLPPHPIYVPPNMAEEETAKAPDPPSGLPFNAQPRKKSEAGKGGKYGSVPPPGGDPKNERFEDLLYNAVIRVVIPTDIDLIQLIHRMIEFVIRDGPMFEAMIMNREISNPKFQFLFDNQSPAHIYYRWKLFSILQGDSPETWRTDEFRMFESGSLWKPPPLKNLRSKILPPITEEVVKRGQLTSKKRDTLEDQLRSISMEREKIRTSMIWCLDHAESAEEIVDCISEALCIVETPLPMKIARLYLTNDILQNCSPSISNASNFRRGFEAKLLTVMEHFHSVLKGITSRMRAESFKRRVLSCLRAWDKMSVYHFNFVDKLRETFIGKTHEELEKLKAFETVAALISTKPEGVSEGDIDGVPLMDDQPIDFSKGVSIDGVPMGEDLDGEPLPNPDLDGVPLGKEEDLDGVPMEEPTPAVVPVRSKWELVDYGDDSDDQDQLDASPVSPAQDSGASLSEKQRKELLAELDERKRRILRDVELKVVELTDALEASGSYSKAEIAERVDKYRDRLMQEAVEPKWSPEPDSKTSDKRRGSSRSPSPSTLAKYNLASSPKHFKEQSSRGKSPEKSSRRHSKSPERSRKSPERSRKRSQSPGSPSKRKRSSSPSRKRHRSPRSPSPKSRRSRSASPPPSSKRRKHSSSPKRRRSHSRSPARKRSQSPARRRSRSRSPGRKRSPARRRSRSRSPATRKRSRSPKHSSSKRRSRSKSPRSHRHRSRSWSPGRSSSKKTRRSRSRSRSPHKSSKSSSKKSGKH